MKVSSSNICRQLMVSLEANVHFPANDRPPRFAIGHLQTAALCQPVLIRAEESEVCELVENLLCSEG